MSVFRISVLVGTLVLVTSVLAFAEEPSQEGLATSWLDKVEIGVGATSILQGQYGADEEEDNSECASSSFDVELALPIEERGRFLFLVEAGTGEGIDPKAMSLSGFNADADNDPNLRLTEMWYEHHWFGERILLRAGKIDLTAKFDVNDVANSETDQFLSGGFVNNLAIEFPDDNGFGVMALVSPVELVSIDVGAADADGDWNKISDNLFVVGQLGFHPQIGKLPGNVRVFGWFNGKDHVELIDSSKTSELNMGFGVSFDQKISETANLFARYGVQRGDISQIESALSAGLCYSLNSLNRRDDELGFAWGMAQISEDWQELDRVNGIDSGSEQHGELYYMLTLNEYLHLTPNIQWISCPAGNRDADDVWILGVRAHLSF